MALGQDNLTKKKIHLIYLPLNMEYVYHIHIPLGIESLPLKVRFLPLEAYMDAEAVALHCE